jgi:hypothetical protein
MTDAEIAQTFAPVTPLCAVLPVFVPTSTLTAPAPYLSGQMESWHQDLLEDPVTHAVIC